MGHDAPPTILLQKVGDVFKAYDRLSASAVANHISGQVYTAKPRKGRTLPRNAAYWAGLGNAVNATDAWPTSRHLHEDLKRLCGYVDVYHNPLTGRDEVRVQSTKFDAMSESEFAAYFRLAQMKFMASMGFDPWAMANDALDMRI
jgi:hypothetical protein